MPGFDNKIVFASNVDFTGNSLTQGTAQIASNGQLLIGSATGTNGPCLLAGFLTSSDGSITVTNGSGTISLVVAGGSTVGKTITGNTGGALVPTLGNWNIFGAGSITTGGTGSTLTVEVTGLTNHAVLVGSGGTTITNIAATANTGAVLQNNSGADPSYSTATYPSTTAQGDLLLSSAANTITTLAKSSTATNYLSNTGSSNNAAWAQVALTTGVSGILPIANGGTDASSFTQSNGIVVFDGTRLVNYSGPQIDTSGRATNTTQPAFLYFQASDAANVTGDGTLYTLGSTTALTQQYDNDSNMNTNGTFTAPVTGIYCFCASVDFSNAEAGVTSFEITFVANGISYSGPQLAYALTSSAIISGTVFIKMTAAQTCVVKCSASGGATKGIKIAGAASPNLVTFFSGFLVC